VQTVDVDRLDLSTGDWVLDLGCGEGRHMHALHWTNLVHAVGLDLNRDSLQTAREGFDELEDENQEPRGNWYLQQGDALRLPYPSNQFDVVICSEVLEHLPDYDSALDEIDRVLKSDGQLAVSVPRYGPEAVCWWLSEEYHQVEGGHVRIFRENELKDQIESTGFRFESKKYKHGLHAPFWWLKCLLWNRQDDSRFLDLYERFLEWDLTDRPRLTRWIKGLLDPLIGKSTVLYFSREGA
jgi:ubiquinone/menaquinone biosynthesis C-methylase UbiE